jgi:hypothetical protein
MPVANFFVLNSVNGEEVDEPINAIQNRASGDQPVSAFSSATLLPSGFWTTSRASFRCGPVQLCQLRCAAPRAMRIFTL